MERIGYIGLGTMGQGMCANLQGKGAQLTVWNRTAEKAAGLAAQGVTVAGTAAELAAACDVVCLCVCDTPDVEDVLFGAGGVATSLRPGALVIDFSTISARRTVQFAARLAERGVAFVDAPVTGGDVGARNGTLTIMVGGSTEAFARAAQVFEHVGKAWHHLGPVGAGQKAKMVNQVAVLGTLVSMAEAMNFARENGMNVEAVIPVVAGGAAGSWTLANYAPRVLRGDYAPGFSIKLFAKDLRLVREALEGATADYTLLRRMDAIFQALAADDHTAGEGVHAVVKALGWPVNQ